MTFICFLLFHPCLLFSSKCNRGVVDEVPCVSNILTNPNVKDNKLERNGRATACASKSGTSPGELTVAPS